MLHVKLRTIFLFHVLIVSSKCLLNPASSVNSHSDQIIEELQRNMTKLQQRLEATILDHNRTMTDLEEKYKVIQDQNRTISDLTQKQRVTLVIVGNQQRTVSEMNQTIREQHRKIERLETQSIEQNVTIMNLESLVLEMNQTIGNEQQRISDRCNEHYRNVDGRMNATFSAYQLILHDVVDKHNQYATQSDNQTRVLDQRVADLGKQFHYLSLSVGDARKEASILNTSLQGEGFCIII